MFLDTDKGTIEIELAVLDAPLTCGRTSWRWRGSGYFTGVAIHRVVPNFVVQDGDPRGDGEGEPGLHDPRRDQHAPVPARHGRAWRSTAPTPAAASGSSRTRRSRTSTAKYTVFGRVVAGMDVVDRLQQWDVIRRVRTWDGVELVTK